MRRRSFVKLALSAAVLSPLGQLGVASPTSGAPGPNARGPAGALPDAAVATLRSIAPVVLPKALGRRGVDAVTDRFLAWIDDYRAGALMEHGYGHPRIRRTPESPTVAYIEQLKALEQAADRQHHQAFTRLSAGARRAIVESAFREAKVDNLPNRPNGKHIVADLMAFYFQSSEANDHCYQRAIGRETCRPLSQVAARPRPLV